MINKRVQLVIPMSGTGERFLVEGFKDPKPLIDVVGRPMIEHVLGLFPGAEDVIFICNKEHLEKTEMRGILNRICPTGKIVSIDGHKKGPVYAVLKAESLISDGKEIIVSYCDYGTEWDCGNFLRTMEDNKCDGGIPSYIGFHPHMLGKDHYAYVRTEGDTAIEIREKRPFTDNKMSEFASNGTYYFKNGKILKKYFKRCIEENNHIGGEFYVSMVYNDMIKDGLNVEVFEIDKMLQWGTPYDLRVYRQWMEYFQNCDTKPLVSRRELKDTTLLLPMAGNGNRFETEGYGEPKPFLEVDGLPMFARAIKDLPACENVVLGVLKEHIEEASQAEKILKYAQGVKIAQIASTTEGQACTVEIMLDKMNVDVEKPILISACDNGMYYDQEGFQAAVEDLENDVIVCSFRNHETSKNNPNMYAWLEVDDGDVVRHVSCKNFIYDNPLKTHAIIGTMFFRKAKYFLDGLKENYAHDIRTNGEFYVDDVLNQNIKNGLKVKVFEALNYICWGTPNDYKTYLYWKEHYTEQIKQVKSGILP